MKKTCLIVCTFLVLLLAGCASTDTNGDGTHVVKLDTGGASRVEGDARDPNAIPKSGVVTQVMTPDEFFVDGKWQVHLAGVDAPIADEAKRFGDYYGKEAFERIQEMILNQEVKLDYDVYAKDYMERLMAYVTLEDGTYLNEYMIKNGYGIVACIPPNKRDCSRFVDLQREAVAQRRGLWDVPDIDIDADADKRRGSRYGRVASISDGDTIRLESGTIVRYIGIDSPEEEDQLYQAGSLAEAAMQRNTSLVLGKEVELEYDIEALDPRGRDLAYVYVRLANGNRVMVNEVMVAEGLAWVAVFPPNVARIPELLEAQRKAMDAGLGVWRTEDFAQD